MNYVPGNRNLIRWTAWIIAVLAVYQIGLGLYFIAFRPPLLPEDLEFMALSAPPIPLMRWLNWVFTVLGGQMIAVGLLLVPLASPRIRAAANRQAHAGFAMAGLTSVGLMSAVNFMLSSDFRWLLLAPVALWAIAIALVWIARPEN